MLKITTKDILDITNESFLDVSIEKGTLETIDKSLYLNLTLNIENKDKEYSKYMEYFVILADDDSFLEEFNDNTFNLVDVKNKVFTIKRFYSIENFITLKVDNNIENLRCFIIPILNIADFLFDNKLDYTNFEYEYITNNQIISDLIIENSKLLSQTYIFYDKKDNIYFGPVLKEGNSFYSSENEELTFSLVPNNKFIDYRIFSKISQKDNFFELETPLKNLEINQIKKNYINNHGVSQSDKDIFNHYFSFNFFDCFKENILLKKINYNNIPFSLKIYKRDNMENISIGIMQEQTEYGIEYPANNNFSLYYSNNTQNISGEQRFVFDELLSSFKVNDSFLFCLKNEKIDKVYNDSYFVKFSFKDPSLDELQNILYILVDENNKLKNIYNSYIKNDQNIEQKIILSLNKMVDFFDQIEDLSKEEKEYLSNNLYTALSVFYGTEKTFFDALTFFNLKIEYYKKILNNTNQKTNELEFSLRLDDIKNLENISLFSIFDKNIMTFDDIMKHNQKIIEKNKFNSFDYSLIKGKQTYNTSEQIEQPEKINSYELVKVFNGKEYFLDKESFNEIRFAQLLFELFYNDSLQYFCDISTLENLKNFIESKINLNKSFTVNKVDNDIYKIISGASFIQSLNTDKKADDYKKKTFDYISLCINLIIGYFTQRNKKLDIIDFLSNDSKNSIFKKYNIDEEYFNNLPYHYKCLIFTNIFTNVLLTLHYYFIYKNIYFIEFFDTKDKQWKKIDFLTLKSSTYICRFSKYTDEFINEYIHDINEIKINLLNKVFIIDKKTEVSKFVSDVSLQQIKPSYNNNKVTTNNFLDKEKVNKINNAKKF